MKLAFVTPWYGNIPGGAEAEARRTAEQLANAGIHTEVLTTCIQDFYADWGKNSHKAGVTVENGVTVRRFRVKRRNKAAFDAVNAKLMQNLPITPKEERTYIEEMIKVPALYDFIRQHQSEYLFIFIPYMFATTYFGVQIAPERSLVIPCLHDESYARLSLYRETLPNVRALILHTHTEATLTQQLFGDPQSQIRAVLGEGVDTDFTADGSRFREKYGIQGDFVYYVGRQEPGKNTPLLLDYWRRYRAETGTEAMLILAGPGGTVGGIGGENAGIRNLGFIPAQDKYDGYHAATIFCQPSVNESFSLVIMESWLTGTPILVHGKCAPTREHVIRANGGLYFKNYAEFAGTLNYLFNHPKTAQTLGKQGQKYVLDNFKWDIIVEKYQALISRLSSTTKFPIS